MKKTQNDLCINALGNEISNKSKQASFKIFINYVSVCLCEFCGKSIYSILALFVLLLLLLLLFRGCHTFLCNISFDSATFCVHFRLRFQFCTPKMLFIYHVAAGTAMVAVAVAAAISANVNTLPFGIFHWFHWLPDAIR